MELCRKTGRKVDRKIEGLQEVDKGGEKEGGKLGSWEAGKSGS